MMEEDGQMAALFFVVFSFFFYIWEKHINNKTNFYEI